jgi:hypothetical protein
MQQTTITKADLETWRVRLENEPEWTARLHHVSRSLDIPVSDLVVLIATPSEFPLAARDATIVRGHIVSLARVEDVACTFSRATRVTMDARQRRAAPEYSHAVIFAPPDVDTVRFRAR